MGRGNILCHPSERSEESNGVRRGTRDKKVMSGMGACLSIGYHAKKAEKAGVDLIIASGHEGYIMAACTHDGSASRGG